MEAKPIPFVMAGRRRALLRADDPAIQVFVSSLKQDVDHRDKPGDDDWATIPAQTVARCRCAWKGPDLATSRGPGCPKQRLLAENRADGRCRPACRPQSRAES